MTDALAVLQGLLRCPSVTPAEGGALDLLQGLLEPAGFAVHRVAFSEPGTPEPLVPAAVSGPGPVASDPPAGPRVPAARVEREERVRADVA